MNNKYKFNVLGRLGARNFLYRIYNNNYLFIKYNYDYSKYTLIQKVRHVNNPREKDNY